jgi:hypothetical protein
MPFVLSCQYITYTLYHLVVFGVPLRKLFDMLPGPKLRVLVLSSPPWGVFADDAHDVPLTKPEIEVSLYTDCICYAPIFVQVCVSVCVCLFMGVHTK